MIKLKQAVVVEGRYDKARLANIFDAPVIETGGFGIYKNAAKRELIKTLARGDGIVIITDPDKADAYIDGLDTADPIVVKADGEAAGKGVTVAKTKAEAKEAENAE